MSGQRAAWLAASVLPPLGALRTAPATARGHVRGTLAVWRLSELTDTVELVVSELTANAVNASAGSDGHPAAFDGRKTLIESAERGAEGRQQRLWQGAFAIERGEPVSAPLPGKSGGAARRGF